MGHDRWSSVSVNASTVDRIYRAAVNGDRCWARNERGHVRGLPVARWLGTPTARRHDRLADDYVLSQCSMLPTLDLGCGPGRFTAMLRARGGIALGVDTSRVAVELTRQRGGEAICADFFQPLPVPGRWHQVLLTDGNVGIGGDPARTLRRAEELLAPGGKIIVEISPSLNGTDRERLRWETKQHTGAWFEFSQVDVVMLAQLAESTGLEVLSLREIHSRLIVVLHRHPARDARRQP